MKVTAWIVACVLAAGCAAQRAGPDIVVPAAAQREGAATRVGELPLGDGKTAQFTTWPHTGPEGAAMISVRGFEAGQQGRSRFGAGDAFTVGGQSFLVQSVAPDGSSATFRALRKEVDPNDPLPVGTSMADVVVRDSGGRATTLGAIVTRRTLVVVWASWCLECRQEMPHVQADKDALAAHGTDVIVVSTDGDPSSAFAFLRAQRIDVPAYAAPGGASGQFAKRFGIRAVPDAFVLGPGAVIERKRVTLTGWDDLLHD